MKSPTYQSFPLITKARLSMALVLYATFMIFPIYLVLQPTQTDLTVAAGSIALLFTVAFVEYFLFFIIPYVLFIRKTGRYLQVRLITRYNFQPFSPFDDEPAKYGAKPYGQLASFLLSTLCLAGFILIVLMPTIYILFASK